MKSRICGALVGLALAAACTAETQPRSVHAPQGERASEVYDKEKAAATAIADAYAKGQAKAWRHAVTAQLARAETMARDDLAVAMDAYLSVVAKRGQQGLEPVLAASLASLGHRDAIGWAQAQDRLELLDEIGWVDKKVKPRPQARAAIKTLGSPVVHHLPLAIVQGLLQSQLDTGLLDLDALVSGDMCSPESLAAFEARWGKEYAAVLADACGQGYAGPAAGGFGPGAIGGLSELDCLFDHEPTRAERIEGLMHDCAESQLGGGGNPFADSPLGSTFEWIFPLRQESYSTTVETPEGKVLSETHYDNSDNPIYRDEYKEDGSVERTYYDGLNNPGLQVDFDAEGNMTEGRAYENGKLTESVTINEDGSYTVRQYDENENVTSEETYGEDNEPEDGMQDPGMEGWGDTAECRELTLALIEDRLQGALESDGIVDPRTVNPDPNAEGPVEDAGAFDCFEVSGGNQIDTSFGCLDPYAHCLGPGMLLDAQCKCQSTQVAVQPKMRCGFQMICSDGSVPQEKDGQCSCPPGTEDWVDEGAGGGPRPLPVDHVGLGGPD